MHAAIELKQLYYESIRDLATAPRSEPELMHRLITRVQLIEELMARLREDRPRIGVLAA